jgi:hypothetical protein
MRPVIREFLALVGLIYFGIGMILTVLGCIAGRDPHHSVHGDCRRQWARVDYLVPSFRLGCWLGEAP